MSVAEFLEVGQIVRAKNPGSKKVVMAKLSIQTVCGCFFDYELNGWVMDSAHYRQKHRQHHLSLTPKNRLPSDRVFVIQP